MAQRPSEESEAKRLKLRFKKRVIEGFTEEGIRTIALARQE